MADPADDDMKVIEAAMAWNDNPARMPKRVLHESPAVGLLLPPRTRVELNRTCAEVTVSFKTTEDAEAFYGWLARHMVAGEKHG